MGERKTTAELLEAWREATRAAELAAQLATHASQVASRADDTSAAADEIAKLAGQSAKAAERAASTARNAAKRAAELARVSRANQVSGGDIKAAAREAENLARDAYHARIADLVDRPENDQ
jgi:methyl-accepting chemotaxis protein